ncbi:hypothetical protein NKG94_08130 [Micromonospora sp. M12]
MKAGGAIDLGVSVANAERVGVALAIPAEARRRRTDQVGLVG